MTKDPEQEQAKLSEQLDSLGGAAASAESWLRSLATALSDLASASRRKPRDRARDCADQQLLRAQLAVATFAIRWITIQRDFWWFRALTMPDARCSWVHEELDRVKWILYLSRREKSLRDQWIGDVQRWVKDSKGMTPLSKAVEELRGVQQPVDSEKEWKRANPCHAYLIASFRADSLELVRAFFASNVPGMLRLELRTEVHAVMTTASGPTYREALRTLLEYILKNSQYEWARPWIDKSHILNYFPDGDPMLDTYDRWWAKYQRRHLRLVEPAPRPNTSPTRP